MLAGIILCTLPVAAHATQAGPGSAPNDAAGNATGEAAISIVPADGKPRGIRLRSQTVSTVISEDATGVWADTDLEVLLQNRGKAPVSLPIGLPGPQPAAYVTTTQELPQILEMTLDKKPLALAPGRGADVRASALITVPVQGTVAIRVRYRQAVPVSDDVAAYDYPLMAGNVWAGAPESVTAVVIFRPPVSSEQVMYLTPGFRTPRAGAYGWSWSGGKAPANAAAAFVTNAWWRGLEEARSAAAAPGAGLAEHAALAERYWRLATLAPPAFARTTGFYDRTVPLALAALRAGIASAGPDVRPEDLARARERLAGLYLAEGNRAGGPTGQTYLQLAAVELAAAALLNPGDPDLAASAAALQGRLAQAATNRGDGALAAARGAQVQALTAGRPSPSTEQAVQHETLALAQAAVKAGDLPVRAPCCRKRWARRRSGCPTPGRPRSASHCCTSAAGPGTGRSRWRWSTGPRTGRPARSFMRPPRRWNGWRLSQRRETR